MNRPVVELTQRHIECLRWAAEGKTAAEIAIILGLSNHTVGHHLLEARRRLGTKNGVHTIAVAIRTGLI